jgi:hypothetical protein
MILKQLGDILSGLSVTLSTGAIATGNIAHNRNELPKEKVPGIILLDADEVRDPTFPERSGRNLAPSSGIMKMTPEIYVVLEVRKPANATVGEDLNTARAAILSAVLHDTILQNSSAQWFDLLRRLRDGLGTQPDDGRADGDVDHFSLSLHRQTS